MVLLIIAIFCHCVIIVRHLDVSHSGEGVQWYYIVDLICVSLTTKIEHYLRGLLAIWIPSFVIYLFSNASDYWG
jgi:hypothetical protein